MPSVRSSARPANDRRDGGPDDCRLADGGRGAAGGRRARSRLDRAGRELRRPVSRPGGRSAAAPGPLARIVGLLGSWCEGEVRSGRPWPGAMRIYWHQWPGRWHAELDRLRGACPIWGLPLTAGDEDRVPAMFDAPLPRRQGRGHLRRLARDGRHAGRRLPRGRLRNLSAAARASGRRNLFRRRRALIFDATDGTPKSRPS